MNLELEDPTVGAFLREVGRGVVCEAGFDEPLDAFIFSKGVYRSKPPTIFSLLIPAPLYLSANEPNLSNCLAIVASA